jgi:uncharacterized GH25 family protein
MMKKYLIVIAFFITGLPILAHEFWLQPEKFIYKRGENINIRFWLGENFEGENWKGNRANTRQLTVYFKGIPDDVTDKLSETEEGDSLQLALFDEGTAVLAFHSTNKFIQLDSAKFNDYLKEDALEKAIQYRTDHDETTSAGREYFQRNVKTIVQVGSIKENISYQTFMPLDIIPLSNPYALGNKKMISVRVLFQKKPLINHVVKVWQRYNNVTTKKEYRTDNKGEFAFLVDTRGKWMASTVEMVHLENDSTADWQSYWGSCTWGYE